MNQRTKNKLKGILESTWLTWLWSMRMELFVIVVAVLAFFRLPAWLQKGDDTAAALDAGVLSMPAVGIVAVVAAVILFFLLVRLCLPIIVDRWFDGALKNEFADSHRISFERDWREAPGWVRLLIFSGLLVAVIIAVAIVTMAAFL